MSVFGSMSFCVFTLITGSFCGATRYYIGYLTISAANRRSCSWRNGSSCCSLCLSWSIAFFSYLWTLGGRLILLSLPAFLVFRSQQLPATFCCALFAGTTRRVLIFIVLGVLPVSSRSPLLFLRFFLGLTPGLCLHLSLGFLASSLPTLPFLILPQCWSTTPSSLLSFCFRSMHHLLYMSLFPLSFLPAPTFQCSPRRSRSVLLCP